MALNISGYVDPGVYIGEVITPAGISLATVPDVLAIVAQGNRSKRSINEAVKRGQIFAEALTLAMTSPYFATLTQRGDRRVSNTSIRRTLAGDTIDRALPVVITGASIAGRPKWVEKFNTHCLYQTRMALEKMIKNGSAHFTKKQGMEIVEVLLSF